MKVSVLIPAFNEEAAVGDTVRRVLACLGVSGHEHEVIVIDDGSTDGTAAAAAAPGVRVLGHPQNAGYGRSLKTGLQQATGEWVVILDADGTYPVEEIPRLLDETGRHDMVVGSRTGPHFRGSFAKSAGRRALQAMVHFVTGVKVPDVNSGFRAFRREDALRNLAHIGNGFSFTTTLTLILLLEGRFVRYVPVAYASRVGTSKVQFRRDILRTLQILLQAILAYNPVKLYLLLAVLTVPAFAPALLADLLLDGGRGAGTIVALLVGTNFLLLALGFLADLLARRPRG